MVQKAHQKAQLNMLQSVINITLVARKPSKEVRPHKSNQTNLPNFS